MLVAVGSETHDFLEFVEDMRKQVEPVGRLDSDSEPLNHHQDKYVVLSMLKKLVAIPRSKLGAEVSRVLEKVVQETCDETVQRPVGLKTEDQMDPVENRAPSMERQGSIDPLVESVSAPAIARRSSKIRVEHTEAC